MYNKLYVCSCVCVCVCVCVSGEFRAEYNFGKRKCNKTLFLCGESNPVATVVKASDATPHGTALVHLGTAKLQV